MIETCRVSPYSWCSNLSFDIDWWLNQLFLLVISLCLMVFKSYIIDYHSGSTKWHQARSWIWANQDWGFNQPLGLSHQEISTLQFALEELIVSMLAKCSTQYWLKFETCCFGSYKFQRCGSVQCKMQRVRNGKMANHRVPRWSDNGYNGARPGPEQIGESLAFLQSAVEGAWRQDGLAVIFLGGDGGGWNSIAGEDPSINWQNWRKNPKIPAWNHRIFHLGALFFQQPPKGSHSNLPWFQDWKKTIFLFWRKRTRTVSHHGSAFPTCEAMVLTAISLNYWLILFAWAGWTGWSGWWFILPAAKMGWASAID